MMLTRMLRFLACMTVLLASGSLGVASAATERQTEAPDYAAPDAWAAYPGRSSHADDVPEGVAQSDDQTPSSKPWPKVPVFFIHPTTYLAPVMGNAAYDAGGEVGARVDDAVLRFQASVFNDCCRIFAPRYRQASLHAVTSNTPAGYEAVNLAYSDVVRAFDAFLKANPEGAFVLASHSQGSIHALRLLQERIVGTPLQRRLVAAYIVGVALPMSIENLGLPICRSETATGCVITWNSVRRGHDDRRRKEDAVIWWDGRYQPIAGRPLVCVNPLDWQLDGDAPATINLGAVYSAGRNRPIPPPIPGLTGARCEDGLLGVEIPRNERRRFGDVLTLTGIYHDFDYGLFYMNIRTNVRLRVRAWLDAHSR